MSDKGQSGETEPLGGYGGRDAIRDHLTSSLAIVVSVILGIATLASVAPLIFEAAAAIDLTGLEKLLASATVFLLTGGVVLGLFARSLIAEIDDLRSEAVARLSSNEPLPHNQSFYGLAFSIFLGESSHAIDTEHHLRYAEIEHDFRNEEDVIFREVMRGHNATSRPTEFLSNQITGDTAMDPEAMEYTAEQRVDDEWRPLEDLVVERLGRFEALFKMYFLEPLAPDDTFELRCSYSVGEVPTQNEQYVFVPQHRFANGTERCKFVFRFPTVHEVEAVKITNTTSSAYFRNVERIDFEMEEFEVQQTQERDHVKVTATDEQTKALYLFRFEC